MNGSSESGQHSDPNKHCKSLSEILYIYTVNWIDHAVSRTYTPRFMACHTIGPECQSWYFHRLRGAVRPVARRRLAGGRPHRAADAARRCRRDPSASARLGATRPPPSDCPGAATACAPSGLLARLATESRAIALGRPRTSAGCALGCRTDSQTWQLRSSAVLVAPCPTGSFTPPAPGRPGQRYLVCCTATSRRRATCLARPATAGVDARGGRPIRPYPETAWAGLHATAVSGVRYNSE